MKLLLRDEVFRHSHLELAPLFSAVLKRRHRIEVDETGPLFNTWLAARSADDREEIEAAIRSSREPLEPASIAVEVAGSSSSSWTARPPVVTVDDANALAWQPFRVLVENSTSDRAFLLSVASDEQRRLLERAEKEGLLEFVQAGGIEQVTAQLKNSAARSPGRRLITFVFVDGDALWPGQPSVSARTVREKCREDGIPCHVLKRRSIENYLPPQSLQSWVAELGTRGRGDREPVLAAYRRMTRAQQWYFHLKKGFTTKHACPLYVSVSTCDIHLLKPGFGHELSTLFIEGKVLNADLRREGALRELQPAPTP